MLSSSKTLQDSTDNRGSSGKGVSALLRWSLIFFLVFLGAGIYAITQRVTEHKALAQQTEQMAVPYVSVIHATPSRCRR